MLFSSSTTSTIAGFALSAEARANTNTVNWKRRQFRWWPAAWRANLSYFWSANTWSTDSVHRWHSSTGDIRHKYRWHSSQYIRHSTCDIRHITDIRDIRHSHGDIRHKYRWHSSQYHRWHSSQTLHNGTTFVLLQTATIAFSSTKFGEWINQIGS